jgi:hypothetical protein
MDRQIFYPGSLPRSSDILQMNKNSNYGLGHLAQAILGTGTVVAGLACTPTGVPSLQVNIAPGSIYTLGQGDATAYGSLGIDSTNIIKQGLLTAQASLTISPPTTAGFSQVFLVQVAYSDVDGGNTVLPYYNAANPSVPWSGPNNSGTSQFTNRQGVCVVQLKAGIAASTGTQTTPAADSGYTGLFAITVANGQTQITSPNIATLATAPFFVALPAIPTLATLDARYPQIIKAPSNLTFYVNSGTGNDNNTGISASNPFATIQGAINKISANYICTGTVIVNVANGSYQGFSISASFVSAWSFVGNTANPNSVLVNATNTGGRGCAALSGTVVSVSGFLFQSYYENVTSSHASLTCSNCNFTAPTLALGLCISSINNGFLLLYGTCSYSGNGYIFLTSTNGSVIFLGYTDVNNTYSLALTISATPSFSGAFCQSTNSSSIIVTPSVTTITGAATGSRYSSNYSSLINTQGSGVNYFPGNAVGFVGNGGAYA